MNPAEIPEVRSRWVPRLVACALFMETLDSTILSTALPAIAESLDEDPLHLSLAITSYLLSLAIFIPLSGWMADRYGARSVFRNAILIFCLGSLGCALSEGIGGLVAARMLQGLGGAMMVPVGRLVLLRSVPKSDLVAAMAFVTIPALIAPILGPPLGGLIVTYASWRWIFIINLPIGVLGWYLVTRFVPNVREQTQPPLDLAGWWLLGSGLAGLVLGFESLGKHVLGRGVPELALGIGSLLLAVYALHARNEQWPILRLSLLRIPSFRVSIAGGTLFRIGAGGFSILLPMMLQLGFGLSALESGLITFSSAIGALAMKAVATKFTRRYGFRKLLMLNSLLCSLSLVGCAWVSPQLPVPLVLGFLVFTGFLRSLQFTCINALAFADVDEKDMSQATSFSGTAQQLALTMGVGIASQALNLSLVFRKGEALAVQDFMTAFFTVAAFSLLSWFSFRSLSADAGNSVSGHRLAIANAPVTPVAD